jgi:hypothetical protein
MTPGLVGSEICEIAVNNSVRSPMRGAPKRRRSRGLRALKREAGGAEGEGAVAVAAAVLLGAGSVDLVAH